jgi:ATP adenylyltransferase
MDELKNLIMKNDRSVTGFNVGVEIVAGQTVFHCHIIIISRRKGDVNNPCGGIRNIIPVAANYCRTRI